MNPFIAVAASVFPEILKAVLGDDKGKKAGEVSDAIVKAVKELAATDDAEEARQKIQADPQIADELRVKLAEIAAADEKARREAELESRRIENEELEKERQSKLETIRLEIGRLEKVREQEFRELSTRLGDVNKARAALSQLASMGSPMAWGAPIVSVIVTAGFFVTLYLIITDGLSPNLKDGQTLQIVNIVIGALTAGFATVVSFWLGSSQGSRNKDVASFELQDRQVQENAEIRREYRAQLEAMERRQPAGAHPVTRSRPVLVEDTNFPKCVEIILNKEGGFVNDADDPGGATNMGITISTLQSWRKETVTVADVENLTEEEAKEIYLNNYWNAMRCGDLPVGVDLVVFDFGVNAGVGRSIKKLQDVVGAKADGIIGPVTLGAVEKHDPAKIIRQFSDRRMTFYRSLPHFDTFGKGWENRTRDIEVRAMNMVS